MNDKTIEWLLEGDAWIQYRTRVDLLGQAETDSQVNTARKAMLADPKIQSLLAELTDWPGAVLNSHKSASQPFHKLAFAGRVFKPPLHQPSRKAGSVRFSTC